MFKSDASRIGYIILAIILFFGSFCIFDLVRQYNITSKVIGYFKHSTDVVKISDFEYDITSLLFTNSGSKENEYFAEVKTSPVEGFDKTKGYTVLINNSPASKVKGEYTYINVNFMNTFNSMQDTELLTDILNIKINFYTDGTKIVFVTENGEQAVKLWSSFIQKNGFKLKIVEDNFKSTIEADNIPTYTINLYVNDEIYQTLSVNCLNNETVKLPVAVNNQKVLSWTDSAGIPYTSVPLKNIDLYATLEEEKTTTTFTTNQINTRTTPEEKGALFAFDKAVYSNGDDIVWTIEDSGRLFSNEISANEYQQNFINIANTKNSDGSWNVLNPILINLKIKGVDYTFKNSSLFSTESTPYSIYSGFENYIYCLNASTNTVYLIRLELTLITNANTFQFRINYYNTYKTFDLATELNDFKNSQFLNNATSVTYQEFEKLSEDLTGFNFEAYMEFSNEFKK